MELDIQKLIEAVGLSVSQAQQTIENHSLGRFFDYFEDTHLSADSGSVTDQQNKPPQFEPKSVKISMPCQEDISKNKMYDVPLVILTHHRQVHLDKVTVKIRTRLRSDEHNKVTADMTAPAPGDCSQPDEPNENICDEINLTFNVDNCSEGVSRVVQNITKII